MFFKFFFNEIILKINKIFKKYYFNVFIIENILKKYATLYYQTV
jgi:hypothetical protein